MIQIESFGINDSYNYGPLSEMLFLISEYEVMHKWWHKSLIMDATASIYFEKYRILTLPLLICIIRNSNGYELTNRVSFQ